MGNSSELCGGSNRLTLYTHVTAVKVQAKFAFANKASSSSSDAPTGSSSSTDPPLSKSSTTSVSGKTTSTTSSPTKQVSTTTSASSHTTTKPSTFISSVKPKSTTTSHTTSSTKTTLIPTPSQTVGSYSYLGCANQTNPLALVGMSKKDAKGMTNEACQAYCLKNNYGLAATQDGDTCYCGNGLQSYSSLNHQTCKTPCAGNSSEICGGHDTQGNKFLSVWNSTSTSIPATTVKQVGYYVSQGCYSSAQNAPILKGTTYVSPNGTSVESCVGYCITKGFAVAGVQGKTCYCDSALAKTAQKEATAACNAPCPGNMREFCGAAGKWNVYEKDLASVNAEGVPTSMNVANVAMINANTTALT